MFTKHAGVTRGKCRHCNTSVQQHGPDWAAEGVPGTYEPYECLSGPPRSCPPCQGLGYSETWEHGERQREVCTCCAGLGEVPGPHWPWRHPEPG